MVPARIPSFVRRETYPVRANLTAASRDARNLPAARSRDRRAQEVVGDEGSRARTKARAGPRACTDVPKTSDSRCMARSSVRTGARESSDRATRRHTDRRARGSCSSVRGRRARARRDCSQARVEIRDVVREPRLDPVRVTLLQPLRPDAVADVELTGGVALRAPGQLLELDPEETLARGRARRIDRQRLADNDRGLGTEEATLCFVHCARHSVEAGRDVDDRGLV